MLNVTLKPGAKIVEVDDSKPINREDAPRIGSIVEDKKDGSLHQIFSVKWNEKEQRFEVQTRSLSYYRKTWDNDRFKTIKQGKEHTNELFSKDTNHATMVTFIGAEKLVDER